MKKTVFFAFILLISLVQAQENGNIQFGSTQSSQEYFFAFKLMPSTTGELVQCAIIRKNPYGDDEIKFISSQTWARQFTGYEVSSANPNKENFALKYNIFEIPSEVKSQGDYEVREYSIQRTHNILANLWRLRYSEYPYASADGNRQKGWAAHPDKNVKWLPSDAQMEILGTYGIAQLSDFCTGDNVFSLLKDVKTKEWQAKYNTNSEPASTEVPQN